MPEIKWDKLAEKYQQVLDQIDIYEKKVKLWKAHQQGLNTLVDDMLRRSGQTKATTPFGTFSSSIKYTAPLDDPEAFLMFVRQTNTWHLIMRAANTNACREYMEEHGEIPGVRLSGRVSISFKGAKK
jgi:hypothetical protein